MTHRPGSTCSNYRRIRRLLGVTLVAGAAFAVGADAADAPAKPASSCVACHTDAERLKTESAKVAAAPASALQAGKG